MNHAPPPLHLSFGVSFRPPQRDAWSAPPFTRALSSSGSSLSETKFSETKAFWNTDSMAQVDSAPTALSSVWRQSCGILTLVVEHPWSHEVVCLYCWVFAPLYYLLPAAYSTAAGCTTSLDAAHSFFCVAVNEPVILSLKCLSWQTTQM